MTKLYCQRMTAEIDDGAVVFLIGMRINRIWKIHKWLPVMLAMTRMLKELYGHRNLGFLSHEAWFGRTTMMVQYWKSFEHLNAYAKNADAEHLPAWRAFNRTIGSSGDVGIWHETYIIDHHRYESIYHHMPRFGLAKAGVHSPITGAKDSAAQRIKQL